MVVKKKERSTELVRVSRRTHKTLKLAAKKTGVGMYRILNVLVYHHVPAFVEHYELEEEGGE